MRRTFLSGLKVHCHAIECFFVDFLWSKVAARTLDAAAPANEKQTFAATDRSSAVLVRRSFKTRDLSGAFVYSATQYNVHYDYRQARHLLSALRLEGCTAAIIFPHNTMAQKITE